jgi:hypothetical protein
LDLELMEERTLLSDVHALFDVFDLSALTKSPFPSDRFAVPDKTQNTGLRVNLPNPEPDPQNQTQVANYQDTQVINTLDGFNLQPQLSIPFDGAINVYSVNSQDVFLVSLGDTLPGGDPGGEVVGINQVVWDPPSNTLHVESDQLLDQHTTYALIVTDGVQDTNGRPVQASDDFKSFRNDLNFGQTKNPILEAYRTDLLDAMAAAARVGAPVGHIVTASVFTTQSATAVLEKIRDQIHAATPAPANFDIGSNGEHTVYDLKDVTGITINQQKTISTDPSSFTKVFVDPLLLKTITDVGARVAFGEYSSPNYEVPDGYIQPVGSRTGTPVVQGYNDIYFTLYLPSGDPPPGGWPVMIWGHGGGSNKDGIYGLPAVAATMAANGIATIGINAVGHGYGSASTLTVAQSVGGSVTLPAGGRGFDQNGDGAIGVSEGYGTSATSDHAIVSESDANIQTDADLMQLVRVIETGVDVDGKGSDLNPSRIYYAGASLGGNYGTPFLAVEPDVTAGVLDVMGGSRIDARRLGITRAGNPPSGLSLATILSTRYPSLINGPGIISLDGLNVTAGPYFNENMPLRDGEPLNVVLADGTTDVIQSPETRDVPGAMALQENFDNWEWVSQPSNPVAYAPHLRKNPLPGVPAKSVIVQFDKGDQYVVNPTTTAFLRAGDLADRATYYRYDLTPVYQNNPNLRQPPGYPHTFGALITNKNDTIRNVALAAQQQVATFFATDGTEIIHPVADPNHPEYFETPIQGPLPEGLNYTIPPSALAGAPAPLSGSQASGSIATAVATETLNASPLDRPLTAAHVPASNPLSRAVMPTSAVVDVALEALPPLGWPDSALDLTDLATGLLRSARHRR